MTILKTVLAAATATVIATGAFAAAHAALGVVGADQDVSGGTVTAEKITAGENGYLVVHRVKEDGKPGPVVGYSPIKAGENMDVTAILTEPVASGDKLMLMIHAETGGMQTGVFEYTLGAKEDGPIRVDGNLVMTVISAK
jgi:hypothetical protein